MAQIHARCVVKFVYTTFAPLSVQVTDPYSMSRSVSSQHLSLHGKCEAKQVNMVTVRVAKGWWSPFHNTA